MPTTVTSSSGRTYHLFQLAEPSYWEPEESIRFTELENDLGDGYSSQVLYGANTGLRSWKLKLPTLAHTDVLPNTVTDVSGATVSREEYLWNLFCHTKVTGEPFVFISPRDGQYHLVRFADKELSYQKMRVKIYSTGVELKQVRIPGEAIFSPITLLADTAAFWLKDGSPSDQSGNGNGFDDFLDVITASYGGHTVARFNSVTSTGNYLALDLTAATFYDIFLVMKIRSGTFPATEIEVFGGSGGQILTGDVGATTFNDYSFADYEYRLNSTLYADSNQQAPMDNYGVVHLRFTAGKSIAAVMFGIDDPSSAKMDIAEVLAFSTLQADSTVNQINEYLTTKWGIT